MRKMKTEYTTFSEAGRRRANQDVFCVVEIPEQKCTLFVVCDGMGGHAMGDVAAETVCSTICRFWQENPQYKDSVQKTKDACSQAAEALYRRSRVVRPIEMGTTLAMASIEGDIVTIAHCGDSRCYLLRNGEVVYQTKDHSDTAMGSEIVSRCFFSMAPEIAVPDIEQFSIKPGDRIFLCTDGVYKSMAPQILTARLQDEQPLEVVADVVKFMCEKYSTDNYTGILAEIV